MTPAESMAAAARAKRDADAAADRAEIDTLRARAERAEAENKCARADLVAMTRWRDNSLVEIEDLEGRLREYVDADRARKSGL